MKDIAAVVEMTAHPLVHYLVIGYALLWTAVTVLRIKYKFEAQNEQETIVP